LTDRGGGGRGKLLVHHKQDRGKKEEGLLKKREKRGPTISLSHNKRGKIFF